MQIIKIHAGDIVATGKFRPPALYYGENVDFNLLYNDDESAYNVIHDKVIHHLITVSVPGSHGLLSEHHFKDASYFNAPQSQGTYNENY